MIRERDVAVDCWDRSHRLITATDVGLLRRSVSDTTGSGTRHARRAGNQCRQIGFYQRYAVERVSVPWALRSTRGLRPALPRSQLAATLRFPSQWGVKKRV